MAFARKNAMDVFNQPPAAVEAKGHGGHGHPVRGQMTDRSAS